MSIFRAAVAPVSDGTLPSVHCILLFGLRPTILFGPRPLNLGLVPFGLCPVFGASSPLGFVPSLGLVPISGYCPAFVGLSPNVHR